MIHPTAIISKKAKIDVNVQIGPFTIVHDNVHIQKDTVIENHCEIGHPTPLAESQPLIIGPGSLIRSYSLFYEGSTFGEKLVTGHRVSVREKTRAGKNLQIGTLSDIQGHCEFGDYVRMHSNVHIGQKSKIGNFVWIFPYVVLTNDPHPPSQTLMGVTVEDYAVIATMSVILPGVRIARHSLVAAHSMVSKDVPEGKVFGGSPAKELCETSKIKLKNEPQTSAYPWTSHFHRGYPTEVTSQWRKN